MNNHVYALAVGPDSSLYAGGVFTTAGGGTANHIAHWDGSQWHPLGSGIGIGGDYLPVLALAVSPDGSLYAGGYFGTAGGVPANNIARWDGAQWHPLGSGMVGLVYALAFGSDGSLYAGGYFATAGGKPSSYIAQWMEQFQCRQSFGSRSCTWTSEPQKLFFCCCFKETGAVGAGDIMTAPVSGTNPPTGFMSRIATVGSPSWSSCGQRGWSITPV